MDKSLCPASGSFDFTHSPHKWLPTIVSCGKHGSALSTGFNPRLRFCWRPRRLKINLRGNLMYFRKPDIRSHQLDVQETNVSSVIRFYKVRNYWVECWFDNGRATCSWHVGLGDRSVAFIKEYRITNPLSSKKLLAKSQIQTQTKRETEMLINCRMWTTSPQTHILLKASLSCPSLKTVKQWSKISSKAEVQRWDTCQELTELRLIGYLTESIGTPRSKSKMLTPTTNSRKCWQKVVLHVMNGIIFFICWTSWIFLMFSCSHFLSNRKQSAMSKRAQESTAKEGSAVAKPRPMNVVSRNLLVAKQNSSKDSNSPGNQELDQSYVSPSVRKLMRNKSRDPTAYSQSGDKMTLYFWAPGNWSEVMTYKSEGRG